MKVIRIVKDVSLKKLTLQKITQYFQKPLLELFCTNNRFHYTVVSISARATFARLIKKNITRLGYVCEILKHRNHQDICYRNVSL